MQIMLSLARSRFAAWLLACGIAVVPTLSGIAAELRGRSTARFTRQVIEEEPPAEMPAEPAPPARRAAPMEPMPSDAMPEEPMPQEELPLAPRVRRAPAGATQPRGTVIRPYEEERYIGDLGGYSPETARRLGICYPQTGACGLACGGCYPCYTWGSIDFVYMWRKGQTYPPLVTTNPIGTSDTAAGTLDNPTTRVLFGGNGVDAYPTPGGRAEVGIWGNQCQTVGIGGRFLAIGDEVHSFNLSNTSNPIIGVPLIELDPFEVGENAILAAHPDRGPGSVAFNSTAYLYAGDAFLRFKFWEDCVHRLDLVGGYTFAKIGDGFTFDLVNTDATGTRRELRDEFAMTNRFDGASLGGLYVVRGNCWSFTMLGKCGLGTMRHTANITGTTDTTANGVVTTTSGGLFAQPTNIGRHEQSEFAIMPEMQVKVGYRIHQCLEITAGYNGLYWNRMAQAGEQVDRTLNSTQFEGGTLTGAPRPEFAFHLRDYWVQGITLGLQGSY
jgi:hypothetical protein